MLSDHCVAEINVVMEQGVECCLRYYVTVIKTGQSPVYGLKIEKYRGNGSLDEEESTPGLTDCYDSASALANRFARGIVTPMTLNILADEWIQ